MGAGETPPLMFLEIYMAKRRKNRKIPHHEIMARKAIAFAIANNPSYLVEITWEFGSKIMLSEDLVVEFKNGRAKIPLAFLPEAERHGCKRAQ
jgi:hypothetical protein